jgi:penicillin-binding protein 1A
MKSIKRIPFKKILISLAVLLSSAILLAVLFFLLVYFGGFGRLPGKAELSAISNEEASRVYSSDNILIGEYFAENRTNIHREDIPPHLVNALIATEDKRFFTHKGFDTQSYFRVFLKSILLGDNSSGGGSTLTQQLVKNLFGRNDYGFLSMPVNKIKEIIIASRIEELYTKEELLTLYFNSVPFSEDVYGVETAAHRYFNKQTKELTVEESAVLVGMLKANTYYNPRLNPAHSLARRNMVLKLMARSNYLTAEASERLQKLPLKLDYENVSINPPAGYFVYQVKKKTSEILESIKSNTGKDYKLEKDGLRIYTTLNMQVQDLATESIKKQLSAMQKLLDRELENYNVKKKWYKNQKQHSKTYENDTRIKQYEVFGWEGVQVKKMSKPDSLWHYYKMLNAAVLITNPKDGAVLTWIGGNDFSTLPFDMVLSHRQIASAFKPFLYATAIEKGESPCLYLTNEVNKYPEYEDWEPQNANHASTPDSTVALWYALAHSMNLPTVDLFFRVGGENLVHTCRKLKFPPVADNAPSVALGTLDLSLYETVRAYSAFANQGRMNELVMITKITDSKGNILYSNKPAGQEMIFSQKTAQILTAILQEAINQGTGARIRSTYGIHSALAGKTGTAQNYSDAWFIAYTPDIVLGTWVGARTSDIHFFSSNGSGTALALPIVANVLRGMETDAGLQRKFLTSFGIPDDIYSFLQCDPYRQVGIGGFFNRLFSPDAKKDTDPREIEKEKESKGGNSFFRKIFKRKK